MARFKATAADFDCYIDGKLVAWNNEFGLQARWRAANNAEGMLNSGVCEPDFMSVIFMSAQDTTDLLCSELNESILIKPKVQELEDLRQELRQAKAMCLYSTERTGGTVIDGTGQCRPGNSEA